MEEWVTHVGRGEKKGWAVPPFLPFSTWNIQEEERENHTRVEDQTSQNGSFSPNELKDEEPTMKSKT